MPRFSEGVIPSGAVALLLFLAIALSGCDQLQTDNTAKANTPQPPPRREHHFDPITRSEGSLAVDTATGQMCKTWNWVCSEGDSSYNQFTKKYQDNMSYGITCSAIREMPTCESISRE
jgi:hypothetical protein